MQSPNFIDFVAWTLIIIGSLIILSGIVSMLKHSDSEIVGQKRESKGIILLGPIPIVWGYGKKTWIAAAIVAIALFVLAYILLP
ncbi:MAG: DUF131 domain-containing protein [Candidatus Thorarchaeota archaeon]